MVDKRSCVAITDFSCLFLLGLLALSLAHGLSGHLGLLFLRWRTDARRLVSRCCEQKEEGQERQQGEESAVLAQQEQPQPEPEQQLEQARSGSCSGSAADTQLRSSRERGRTFWP